MIWGILLIKMKKRLLILFFVLVVFIGIGIFISNYINRQKNTLSINLSIPDESIFKLYRLSESSANQHALYEFKSSGQYKVDRNNYSYVLSFDNPDYKEQTGSISITDQKVDISLSRGGYSSDKLKELLATELPNITSAIKNKYPEQLKSYQIESAKLYQTGEWFGAKLVQKNSIEFSDKYLIILKKENGIWQVVVTPNLTLSKDVYPDIPIEVLRDINILN